MEKDGFFLFFLFICLFQVPQFENDVSMTFIRILQESLKNSTEDFRYPSTTEYFCKGPSLIGFSVWPSNNTRYRM